VIVENRATTVSGVIAAKAAPDGYTLLLAANASWLGRFLQDMPYDAVRDFAPVSTVSNQPVVLVVHPSLPAKSVKELIALAKSKPGELFYGSSSTATVSHLAGELLKALAAIDIVRVPFKGAGPALIALFGNQVQLTFPTPSVVPQHVKAGRLRALAVSSLQPSPLLPDLPTMAASGLPGYEVVSRAGIFAPAKTPAHIINRLNQEIVRALASADVREKILALGSEPRGSTPEEFRNIIKADMTRMGKVIKDAGMREDK
jgi:tripartite-type tricarboxylate transporter receptor subunit TctC